MKTIGAFEAKTHLAELLDQAQAGEAITITRHGSPAAVLMPVQMATRLSHPEIIAGLRALREQIRPDALSVRDMVRAGRRR
ncbi:MAG: type II toxin-antitoxin system prevent-host-death family antitoxin [Acidobacteria bacterium]|nr:MAG: type II toxin-antitoxin system prevent-host-death family antitoxin [Acidobacteriota bacterium]